MVKQAGKSILIVDDEPLTALVHLQTLKQHDFRVYIAHKSEDALEQLRNGDNIGLVLMDMDLQGDLDGAELAEKLLSIKAVPIVFLTYHKEKFYTEKAEEVPNYGYLSKDSSEGVFIETVNMAFQLSEDRRVIEEREKSLKRSEYLLSETQKMAHIGSWSMDLEKDLLYWSDEVYRIQGAQPQEFEASYGAFLEAVHPEDRRMVDEAYLDSIRKDRDGYEIEHRVIRRDTGEIRSVHEKCEHLRNGEGKIVQSIGMVQDVTEVRQRENALRHSEAELKHLFETMSEGFLWTDTVGTIVMANNAAAEMFGYGIPSELIGLHIKELDSEPECWDEYFSSLSRENPIINLEFEAKRRDETGAWMLVNIRILSTQDGEEVGKEILLRDISKRKELEKLKEEVDRIAWHDIRSPLNGVIGIPQILMEEANITDKQREYLQMIIDSGQSILDMINLSLTIYQIEQGSYEYSKTYFDLLELLRQCTADIEKLAESKNIDLVVSLHGFDSEEPGAVTVAGEELLAYSVLSNILRNAVEASPPGKAVEIEIVCDSDILLSLHNRGAVPEEVKDSFFKKYSTSGKEGGTGIGTYSAKILSEAQGWKIEMESSEERGTTVRLAIPPAGGAALGSE